MVGNLGLEPRTTAVSVRCSATELIPIIVNGGLGGDRTLVLRVKSPLLMPLSYKPIKKGAGCP